MKVKITLKDEICLCLEGRSPSRRADMSIFCPAQQPRKKAQSIPRRQRALPCWPGLPNQRGSLGETRPGDARHINAEHISEPMCGQARSPPLPSAGDFLSVPDSCVSVCGAPRRLVLPGFLGTAGSRGGPRQRQDAPTAPRQDAAGLGGPGPSSTVLPGRFFKPMSRSHDNCSSVLV